MEAVARRSTTAVGPPLSSIIQTVRKEIKLGDKAGYIHYRKAGEWLLKAKPQFETAADFYAWAETRFGRSEGTLKNYMMYAQRVTPGDRAQLSEVVRPNANKDHRPDWHKPVQNIMAGVNPIAIAQQAKDSKREQELIRTLGTQIIEIGFKALAAKLHPDKPGGSKESMASLNEARRILRGAL